MSNPGPASTQTNTPTNLATNQALRLIASAQGVNLNSVADTIAPILVAGDVSVQSIKSAYALTGNSTSAKVVVTAATSTDSITGTPLYIRNTTAQGAAATADVFIYGYDLTFLP